MGVYKVFGGCPVKEKRQGKQHQEVTEWKIEHANNSKSVSADFSAPKPSACPDVIQLRAGSSPGLETARLRSAEKHRKSIMSCKMN